MLAVFFLIGSALLGVCLVRRITRDLLDGAEQIMWGLAGGWCLATVAVYLLARWQGQLTYKLILAATAAIWIAAALMILFELRRSNRTRSLFVWRRDYVGLGLILIILAPVYSQLLSRQVFPHREGGIYSGSADNDLAFHAAITSSFVYGKNFPPAYPLLPPEPLLYPYLPDFHAAVLMSSGLSMRAAFILVALILGAVTAGLFYSLALRIARSQRAATMATVLFLLNGGFGFIYFFRDWWQSNESFFAFFNSLHMNYAKISERGLHWTNLVADMLVPQRTSLFGLPLAFMIFTVFAFVWQRWHEDEEDKKGNAPRSFALMIVAGVLAGLLPLFHTHTYIGVGLVSVGLFALRPRREWLAFWTPAVLLAAPQLIPLSQRGAGSGIVHLFFGWLGHDESFFPLYLLRNLGLPLLLAIPAWWAAPRLWRKFYLAFLLPFAVTFLVVVSPNLYDNGKLIYYWHALNSVLVAMWLVNLATVHRQRVLASVLAILCVATALIVFRSETATSVRIFTDEELSAAGFARDHTAPHSLFLTAPTLRQPVLSFAGRAVLSSATAWLWSHGYEFREREADVRRIYAGAQDAFDLLRYYHVDYIYFGDAERSDLKVDAAFFDQNFMAVYRSPGIAIYDAHSSLKATPTNYRDGALNKPAPRELASRLERDPFSLIVDFPRTSFFVYRLCKASFGRMPRREEFMAAMSLLGRGLFVGTNGWQEQREINRTALLNDWTNTAEFKQLYDGKSNDEFVDALLRNAGIEWSAGDRYLLIKGLDSGTQSRQSALIDVVEDKDFYAREFNTAYVLVHFFGYLRRNPDDAPDFDLKGLNFWRDRLDGWGDYRIISRAFIESLEYQALLPHN
jgi:hypothetical protein